MHRRAGHIAIAIISALGGTIAVILTRLHDDLWSPGGLLAVVLLVNAVVRYRLWRG